MTTLDRQMDAFHTALDATGRSPEIPDAADLYGWLIGSWELDVRHYWVDVTAQRITGEAHFGWVLDGRAVQDVWIMPRRGARSGTLDVVNSYGTTLRVWDAAIQAWRVSWINPAQNQRADLIGRRSGSDIVQIGSRGDGTPIRWRFTDIAADSFRWIGESLQPDGDTWKLEGDFRARRISPRH
jgi:hypothetical protein